MYSEVEREMGQNVIDSIKDMWGLFLFSFGIAFLFRRRLKKAYQGKGFFNRFVNDIINCACTGCLSVFATLVLSLVWPQLEDVRLQIGMVGLLSGYGMSLINRIITEKLDLRSVDLNDELDVEEVRREHEERQTKKRRRAADRNC